MVDIERLLVAYLRAHPTVSDIFDGSIYDDIPENASRPLCRLVVLGGVEDTSAQPIWVNRPSLNVDVWGDTKSEAQSAIAAVREALLELPHLYGVQALGEVPRTAATHPAYLPDEEWLDPNGRPGPRFNMTVRVTVHPTRS